MAQRIIDNCGALDIVEKGIILDRKIPFFSHLDEVEDNRHLLTKGEYLAVAQSFNEIELWEEATWEEKQLLSPIMGVRHDFNNAPILLLPKFEPLCSEKEAYRFEESEVIDEFHLQLSLKGMEDYEIGKTLEGFYRLCEDYDLNTEDIIENLSNIGWNPILGCRIIDYGLSNTIFNNYVKWAIKDV